MPAECRDADPVSDLQLLVAGDALVDRHLGATARPAPLDEIERIEAVVLRAVSIPNARRRRATGVDRLAVRLQQLRLEVLNRPCRDLDTVDLRGLRERLLGDRRRLCRLALEAEARSLPVTTASVPAYESTKIASNALSIVSVSTYAPLIIATPRTIASAVRTDLSFLPGQTLQREPDHRAASSSIVLPLLDLTLEPIRTGVL